MATFLIQTDAPEFPVARTSFDEVIPRQLEPDWVTDAELRRLKRRFRGTTPLGREVMRKILVRARRRIFGM